jgi:hypothetical protein
MSKIEKFDEFTNEGLKELAAKMRRTVTGQSAGEEIEKLPQDQQQKLIDLYKQDPTESAKYLRSIIVKEKNSQFGLGLALTIAGAAMIYKAANIEPPQPPPPPSDGKFMPSEEGITQTLNTYTGSELNPKSSPEEFIKSVKDFGGGDYNQGIENLTKGVSGSDKSEIISTLKAIGSDPHGNGDTLGQIFQGDMSGTGKTVGDLLDWPAGTKVFVKN